MRSANRTAWTYKPLNVRRREEIEGTASARVSVERGFEVIRRSSDSVLRSSFDVALKRDRCVTDSVVSPEQIRCNEKGTTADGSAPERSDAQVLDFKGGTQLNFDSSGVLSGRRNELSLERTDRPSRDQSLTESPSVDFGSDRSCKLCLTNDLEPPSHSSSTPLSLSSRNCSVLEEDEVEENKCLISRNEDEGSDEESLVPALVSDTPRDSPSRPQIDPLLSIKNHLEKKVNDAYKSLDQQKQIALQWKKRYDKLASDYSQLELQMEDQLSQRSLLDKKRRKEESDLRLVVDELNREKQLNAKLFKEKELIHQEKLKSDQILSELNAELREKCSRLTVLSEEFRSFKINFYQTEKESLMRSLDKSKKECLELERELEKSREREERSEEERYKAEKLAERLKHQHLRETAHREDQLQQLRERSDKKIKELLCRVEEEGHERTLLAKEKIRLERRLMEMEENMCESQSTATSLLDKMKSKLMKTKALLKDERRTDQSKTKDSKLMLRKLKNQLDALELEKLTAIKTKQKYELEIADLSGILAETMRAKAELERKFRDAVKQLDTSERNADQKEDELNQVMIKYASATQQLTDNQAIIQKLIDQVTELETENSTLVEKTSSLQVKLTKNETLATSSSKLQADNFNAKIKELESKLSLDRTVIARKEMLLSQAYAQLEMFQSDKDIAQNLLNEKAREIKSLTRQSRDIQEESTKLLLREAELLARNKNLVLKLEAVETEKNMVAAELKMANQRITQLKQSLDDSVSCFSDSSTESIEDATISKATITDFKYRSETPDSISSYISGYDEDKK